MRLLGVDLSTQVGLAVMEHRDEPSSIQCGFFAVEGKTMLDQVRDFTLQFEAAVKLSCADFVTVEEPIRVVLTNANTMALMWALYGAAVGVMTRAGIQHMFVPPRVWQALLLPGAGKDTKARAKHVCDQLGIKSATNEHKRDAALIVIWSGMHAQEVKLLERANAS